MSENTNLRQQIHKLNRDFDFTEFFSYAGTAKHAAAGLITPSQALTIPNVKNYTGLHLTTIEQALQAIYDLPDISETPSINQKYNSLIHQSIRMHLINERGVQLIIVMLPKQITRGQLDLLTAYQNTYGKTVEQLSKSNDNTPIVVFEVNKKDKYCNSFEDVIKHAQTLPIIEIPTVPNEFIIGSVVSPNKMTLHCPDLPISLQDHAQQSLNNGVTPEDCNLASRYENLLEHHRPGVSRNE